MSEKTLEMKEERPARVPWKEAESAVENVTEDREVLAATDGREIQVESHVWAFTVEGEAEATTETFTREVFEGTLDRVSTPLKGRLAHVPYSSDDLIRDKRTDVELEDRDS
jgi:hypothetical protein